MLLFTAPQGIPPIDQALVPVFLAGSIEQGEAVDWQQAVINAIMDEPVVVFNPRRTLWDPTWVQDTSNREFVAQVNWELDRIGEAQVIFFYFQSDTLSPISLAELGIALTQTELSDDNMSVVVVCEPGFWRRGNVEIMCSRASVVMYGSLELGIHALKNEIQYWAES